MKNCYVYVRSNGQKDNNEQYIISQVQQLTEMAYKYDYQVKYIFIDPHSSGTGLYGKTQLSEMIGRLLNDHVQAVIISDASRISRTVEAVMAFNRLLKLVGTELVVANQLENKQEAK